MEHSHNVEEKNQTINYLPSVQLRFCDQMSLHKTKGKNSIFTLRFVCFGFLVLFVFCFGLGFAF